MLLGCQEEAGGDGLQDHTLKLMHFAQRIALLPSRNLLALVFNKIPYAQLPASLVTSKMSERGLLPAGVLSTSQPQLVESQIARKEKITSPRV